MASPTCDLCLRAEWQVLRRNVFHPQILAAIALPSVVEVLAEKMVSYYSDDWLGLGLKFSLGEGKHMDNARASMCGSTWTLSFCRPLLSNCWTTALSFRPAVLDVSTRGRLLIYLYDAVVLKETGLEVLSDTGAGSGIFLFILVIFRHCAEPPLTPILSYW